MQFIVFIKTESEWQKIRGSGSITFGANGTLFFDDEKGRDGRYGREVRLDDIRIIKPNCEEFRTFDEERALKYFNDNPQIDSFYYTTDMNQFATYNEAAEASTFLDNTSVGKCVCNRRPEKIYVHSVYCDAYPL